MSYMGTTVEEVAERGQAIYDQQLRAKVEPDNIGKFLVLDVTTGDYEIADRDLIASDRLLARKPDAMLYGVRIGYPTAYRLGGSSLTRITEPK